MKEYLLQQLADFAGVSYISDLHNKSYYTKIYAALEQLNPEHYSLKEWSDAVEYILNGKKEIFVSPLSAWQFLRYHLEAENLQ